MSTSSTFPSHTVAAHRVRRSRGGGLARVGWMFILVSATAQAGAQTGAPAVAPAGAPARAQTAAKFGSQPMAHPSVAATTPRTSEWPSGSTADVDAYDVARTTVVRSAPGASPVAQLRAGAGVQVLARDRGWVRIRTEGWVPEADLTPADTSFRAHLSAADIRSDPAGTRGAMVQWNVEFLATQTADPLRTGLADEEPYILARGPAGENSLLYLVVPPSLMGAARALQPLAKIAVTARVRDGRSEPVGIPIFDLQTIRQIQ